MGLNGDQLDAEIELMSFHRKTWCSSRLSLVKSMKTMSSAGTNDGEISGSSSGFTYFIPPKPSGIITKFASLDLTLEADPSSNDELIDANTQKIERTKSFMLSHCEKQTKTANFSFLKWNLYLDDCDLKSYH